MQSALFPVLYLAFVSVYSLIIALKAYPQHMLFNQLKKSKSHFSFVSLHKSISVFIWLMSGQGWIKGKDGMDRFD